MRRSGITGSRDSVFPEIGGFGGRWESKSVDGKKATDGGECWVYPLGLLFN